MAIERARRHLLLAACLLLASLAQANNDPKPFPFMVTYATSLNGMPLGIDLHMRMAAAENGLWQLALDARSRMMKYHESSLFRWEDCRAEPVRYRFDFSGFSVDRKLWLDFDHEKKTASGESRKGPITFAFPDDVTDELGLSFAARCQLLRGANEVTYNTATTKGMRTLTYRIVGQEKLKTPLGKFDAIRVERKREAGEKRRSTLWLAPSLGYIMIKMEHVEKLGVRGAATIKAVEGISTAAPAK
jgi:hypothetical protein